MGGPGERFRRRLPAPRDPWRTAPVGELQEQLLPRWFVVLALASVPLAIAALVAAFAVLTPDDVPVAERRPAPGPVTDGVIRTTDVGEVVTGDSVAEPYVDACPLLEGVQVAGTAGDTESLRRGLAALCNSVEDPALRDRLERFAMAGGTVRFGVFEQTGVDSLGVLADDAPPLVIVNNRYAATSPRWIAPLVAHDVTALDGDPGTAETALQAAGAEAGVCRALLTDAERSPGCEEAAELLALDDPLAALRTAGYR